MRRTRLKRMIAGVALVPALAISNAHVASAQNVVADATAAANDFVQLIVPGIQIPGMPENQLPFPKMPTVEQVRAESARLATDLDKALHELNVYVDSHRRALQDLNNVELELTEARNNVHISISVNGKGSDEARAAQEEFTTLRNDVRDRANDGDEEAQAALVDRTSKAKQRSATAVDVLEQTEEIDKKVEKADLDESQFEEIPVTAEGFVGSDAERAYYAVEDTQTNEERDKQDQRNDRNSANRNAANEEKDAQRSTDDKQRDKDAEKEAKQQREQELAERAIRVYGIPESPEESPYYAYGNYENPIGNPSLMSQMDDELEEAYGKFADFDVRGVINDALRDSDSEYRDEALAALKQLRRAEADNDQASMDDARARLQPLMDNIALNMYGWSAEMTADDPLYRAVIGANGNHYDPYANPQDQERFEDFVVDVLTTPNKLARQVERHNVRAQREQQRDNQEQQREEEQSTQDV